MSSKKATERFQKQIERVKKADNHNRRLLNGKDVRQPIKNSDRVPINWESLNLDTIVRDLLPASSAANNNEQEVKEFRAANQIQVLSSDHVPDPFLDRSEIGFDPMVYEVISVYLNKPPTPLHQQAWAILMKGLNCLGICLDNDEKIIAYLLPALVFSSMQTDFKPPNVLIIATTNERIAHIQKVALALQAVINYNSANIMFCMAKEFLLIESLETVQYVVIDDFNKIIDAGQVQQVKNIMTLVRPDKILSIWSNVWSDSVQRLTDDLMSETEYVRLNIGSLNFFKNLGITEEVYACDNDNDKDTKFSEILQEIRSISPQIKLVIFAKDILLIPKIMDKVRRAGILAITVKSDQREDTNLQNLHRFRNSQCCALIMTVVTGKETDFDDITHVIHYDFPFKFYDDYLHRVGRIGKLYHLQTVYTLFHKNNSKFAPQLVEHLTDNNQNIDSLLQEYADLGLKTYLKMKKHFQERSREKTLIKMKEKNDRARAKKVHKVPSLATPVIGKELQAPSSSTTVGIPPISSESPKGKNLTQNLSVFSAPGGSTTQSVSSFGNSSEFLQQPYGFPGGGFMQNNFRSNARFDQLERDYGSSFMGNEFGGNRNNFRNRGNNFPRNGFRGRWR